MVILINEIIEYFVNGLELTKNIKTGPYGEKLKYQTRFGNVLSNFMQKQLTRKWTLQVYKIKSIKLELLKFPTFFHFLFFLLILIFFSFFLLNLFQMMKK